VRRILSVVAGIAALAGAVVLVLVAVDARAWSATVRDEDALFRMAPARPTWNAGARAPFGLSARLLGTADDVRLRRAIQALRLAQVASQTRRQQEGLFGNSHGKGTGAGRGGTGY